MSIYPGRMSPTTALKLLDLQVQKKGADYVYKGGVAGSCYYVHGVVGPQGKDEMPGLLSPESESGLPEPGCIVGHVLADYGVPLSELAQHEMQNPTREGAWSFWLSPEAAVLLQVAQRKQDNGRPWGEANRAARELWEMMQ